MAVQEYDWAESMTYSDGWRGEARQGLPVMLPLAPQL